jgi:guanosine-3',5'-bis(diphosphate) 3'-pyrophosphohydrolase
MHSKAVLFVLCSVLVSSSICAGQKKFQSTERPELYAQDIDRQIYDCRKALSEYASGNEDVLLMFDETVREWHHHLLNDNSDFEIQRLLNGVAFAARKHVGQTRKDAAATPYIIHPMGVARILWEKAGVRSVNVLTAALLHDTLEDTETTGEELEALFGKVVRRTVEEVSNDSSLSTDENKQRQVDHAPHMSLNAQLVKLADRYYNICDLRNPPPSWSQEKVMGYLGWGEKLLKALRGTNPALEEILEQEIKERSCSAERVQA